MKRRHGDSFCDDIQSAPSNKSAAPTRDRAHPQVVTEDHHSVHEIEDRRPEPKKDRTKTGCLNCRRRKKKCDEEKPSCSRCCSRSEKCTWYDGLKFRYSSFIDEQPFGEVQRRDHKDGNDLSGVIPDQSIFIALVKASDVDLRRTLDERESSLVDCAPISIDVGLNGLIRHLDDATFAHLELEPLDYLTSNDALIDLVTAAPVQTSDGTPAQWGSSFTSDVSHSELAVDSPNLSSSHSSSAAYNRLHRTLHHHIVETARYTTTASQETADECQLYSVVDTDGGQSASQSVAMSVTESRPSLDQERELVLWQNYLDEIASWLDMFDEERHFQVGIPTIARTSEYLKYSILALSARHLERRNFELTCTESLMLYQTAIELIVPQLASLDISIIASCVLLCVFEMMSSSPRAWGQHLDGCAMLLAAAGINGVVGGVKQALFWCFARMDVWGGFLADTSTKIPTSRWFVPTGSMSAAVHRLGNPSGSFGSYANYAVFLCASVVNVISGRDQADPTQSGIAGGFEASYSTRWSVLFRLLENWYDGRPPEMQPLITRPATEDCPQCPFPTVLYGTPPAVNGNQLYHTSCLLMLQAKPEGLVPARNSRSILWHSRQICGIAMSNSNHGSWINAVQPLWVAGKLLSRPAEHRAILEILSRIEKETGWATSWRAEHLRQYWSGAS